MRILVTAFGPFGPFDTNSSQLCLEALQSQAWETATDFRVYPVDFAAARRMLAEDLAAQYRLAIHLGQSPYANGVQIEAVALNVGGPPDLLPEHYNVLEADGPVAYRTPLPVHMLASGLRCAGIAAQVSYHAGTYLCNAIYYWSHYLAARHGLATIPLLVHLPLAPDQLMARPQTPLPLGPTMPSHETARAIRVLCDILGKRLASA